MNNEIKINNMVSFPSIDDDSQFGIVKDAKDDLLLVETVEIIRSKKWIFKKDAVLLDDFDKSNIEFGGNVK